MIYACCNRRRGDAVRRHATLNGIEFLEVLDDDAPADSPRQRTLIVRCYKPLAALIDKANVRIDGGTRVRPVRVTWAFRADLAAGAGVLTPGETSLLGGLDEPDHVLVVRTDAFGDFSVYTLRLVAAAGVDDPPPGFDPVLSSVDFSFKAECPTKFDCLAAPSCPPAPRSNPNIDYLAKDYSSFRRVMLDRMALLAPDWTERNPADVGVALVELLAYVGDSLSYRQDAVATEAYLHTARRRVSARRHARLVDWLMHDGTNARAFVQVRVEDTSLVVPAGTQLVTKSARLASVTIGSGAQELGIARSGGAQVFETMHRAVLYPANSTTFFHTWTDDGCALPAGATTATLRDGAVPAERRLLRPGDLLVFEEVLGPQTGVAADADPSHRHAVRLTKVDPEASLVLDADGSEIGRTAGAPVVDPLNGQPIVEIEWDEADALPFPFCISAPRTDTDLAGQVFADVSAASGNVLLADHGRTIDADETLGAVPSVSQFAVAARAAPFCTPEAESPVLPRFRPRLADGPVTQVGQVLVIAADGTSQRAPFDPSGPAAGVVAPDIRRALPAIVATSDGKDEWTPERDLLGSGAEDRSFVVEVEGDGSATLRFGDAEHGRRPAPATPFTARYRVGNGAGGNVGAESIAHVVTTATFDPANVVAVRNPLPAAGGIEPETIEDVRQHAPFAFRTQERAVTLDDYAAAALRYPGLQGAAARFRWTGSWRTVFVTLDPFCRDARDLPAGLADAVAAHIEKFRMAGYDLVVDAPEYASLEIELHVCVEADYFAADVERALLGVFASGIREDGTPGLFHPDRFRFGEPVYASPLLAAALAVDGVRDARFTIFQRLARPDGGAARRAGAIELSRLEIARLDADPNFPENGTFLVETEGGR